MSLNLCSGAPGSNPPWISCRWRDGCLLILEPNGCGTCAFTREVPLDEDGDPLPPDPLDRKP